MQQAVEKQVTGITEKCFCGSICHRAHSRYAQQPSNRAAKTFIVIDDSNREMIEELIHKEGKANSQLPQRLLPFREGAGCLELVYYIDRELKRGSPLSRCISCTVLSTPACER